MADTLASVPPTSATSDARRVSDVRLVTAQVVHANRSFRRNPLMAVVTLAFPLGFLLMLGIATGDSAPDPSNGAAPIQVTAPVAAVFAAIMAAFVMLPFQVAQAKERGVLKRLNGTPLPMWAYVAGQVLSAVVVAAAGTALMLAVAFAAFGLELPVSMLSALLVSFLLGVGCAAALGVAIAALVRGAETVITLTMGSFLLLAFASGMFAVGAELPRILDVITWWFPLRHFSSAFGEVFVAPAGATGFAWSHLVVLAAWTAAGSALAVWGFRRAPRLRRDGASRRARHSSGLGEPQVAGEGTSPRLARLVLAQARHANRALWRVPASAFFSVAFPVLFTIVVPYALGNPVIDGVPLPRLVVPAMAVFAVIIIAFVNVPENVAIARDEGILKRLRGTPLPASGYLLGRLASVAWVAAVAVIGVLVAGWAVHGVSMEARSVLPLTFALVAGTVAFAALGLAVVALVPDAGSVPAVGLGVFLPLGFISDMLAFGMEMPGALSTIGWIFPLKHLMHSVEGAIASGAVAFGHLGFVVLWGAVGAVVAVKHFRWEPAKS